MSIAWDRNRLPESSNRKSQSEEPTHYREVVLTSLEQLKSTDAYNQHDQ